MRFSRLLSAVMMGALVVGGLGACGDSETTDGSGGSGNTASDGGSGGTAGSPGTGGDGSGGDGSGGSPMCLPFGSTCSASDTCCDVAGETGECFAFGMGDRCTIPCPANPADCPAGQGCNNQSPPKCKVE